MFHLGGLGRDAVSVGSTHRHMGKTTALAAAVGATARLKTAFSLARMISSRTTSTAHAIGVIGSGSLMIVSRVGTEASGSTGIH